MTDTQVFPGTFADAIISTNIREGDTLLLRGGTYTAGNGKGIFDVWLNGSPDKPVTIRNYPGESVRINGSIHITNGTYVTVRGLEIAPTPTNRDFSDRTGHDLDYSTALRFWGRGCKAINCIIHDGALGMDIYEASPAEVYGCVIYNNGWLFGAGDHTGYGIYTHNNPALRIDIKHNLFSKDLGGYALHLNSANNKIKNYYITENGSMGSIVLSSATVIEDCFIDRNHFFRATPRTGQSGFEFANIAASFTNNRIYSDDGISSTMGNGQMQSLTFTGNIGVVDGYQCEATKLDEGGFSAGEWNNNAYYYPIGNAFAQRFYLHGTDVEGSHTFAEWKSLTGYDADSTLTSGMPGSNEVFVYPNAYKDADDNRMGILIIWNWTQVDSISVDLSSLSLANGAQYRFRQAQDPFIDTTLFTYSGPPVSVDMRAISHSVAIPTALDAPIQATSFPVYGAFIIEKV